MAMRADLSVLPHLSDDQQKILVKVWTGAGVRTREASMVLAREFGIQPWQVSAWATHLGVSEADQGEFIAPTKMLMGEVPVLPPAAEEMERMAEPVASKLCMMCGEVKPINRFRSAPKSADGRSKNCLDCQPNGAVGRWQLLQRSSEPAGIVHGEKQVEKQVEIIPQNIPPSPPEPEIKPRHVVDGQYEMLYMLLHKLPESGRWTQREYERWSEAFNALLDLLVRVEEEEAS